MDSVRSKKRVADHGEVFTPPWIVDAMLNLVRDESERIDSRFLESAFMRNFYVSRDIVHRARSMSPRAVGARSASRCRPGYSVASRLRLASILKLLPVSFKTRQARTDSKGP